MTKKRMMQTARMYLIRGSKERGDFLRKKHIFAEVGENVHFQPRLVPLYPELIKLHNNIMVSAGVRFITHDASFAVLNRIGKGRFPEKVGCIEVMDNVYIGYNVTIMPNVRICENVIVGAGALVSRDLEPNGVYVGTPAKKIGSFDDYVERHCKIEGGGTPIPMLNTTNTFPNQRLKERGSYTILRESGNDRKRIA